MLSKRSIALHVPLEKSCPPCLGVTGAPSRVLMLRLNDSLTFCDLMLSALDVGMGVLDLLPGLVAVRGEGVDITSPPWEEEIDVRGGDREA